MGPKAVECAVFDNTTADGDPAYMAPKCPPNVEGCSTCGLVDGNGNSSTNPEPNNTVSNNTLYNTCSDQAGTGPNSPVRIMSIQVESLAESGFIQPQKNIKVTVRAWSNNNNQWIDVLYTQDADENPPTFTYLGSYRRNCNASNGWGSPVIGSFCSRSGNETTIVFNMTLTAVTPPHKMAIRARIQNSNAWQTEPCYTGSTIYDHDDLVFTVQDPPSSFSCGVYNPDFRAPVCYGDGWCGTCETVPCRDTVNDTAESPTGFFYCTNGGNEPYQPNTLFSNNPSLRCLDTNHNDGGSLDEQVRRINVRSLDPSGQFKGGSLVEVSFLVACYPGSDQMVVAYGSGVTYSPSPITNWRYITTLYCPQGGSVRNWHVLSTTLQLDNVEGWHAVRVVLGYCPGCATQTNICPASFTYRDADDFVFYVKAVPPSDLPACATFDNTTADGDPAYQVPKCPVGATDCSTCNLTISRDNISGTAEPNQPNTISTAPTCADDTVGIYLQTESIERIMIRSFSGTFQPGATAEVSVVVYCDPTFPNYLNNYLILLYSSNANSPSFTRVLTATCSSPGYQLFRTTITLANVVGPHVVRAMFQQGAFGPAETCAGGGTGQDGDTDDLVFIVGVPQAPSGFDAEGVSPDAITLSWTDVSGETHYELRWTDTYDSDFSKWITHSASPLTANTSWYIDRPLPEGTYRCYALRACNANGCSAFVWDCATVPSLSANCAVYDSTWRVPRCDGGVNNCSTCDLVVSRDSLLSRAEQNTPNAWYSSSCIDGSSGNWYSSRTIEKITLTTTASSFSPGYPITVTVRAFCSSTADYVHLYVSAGTSPISWSFIGSSACTGSNKVEDKNFSFTPSANNWYVIRAVVTGATASTCPDGSYDEVDDIAVRVGGVPPVPSGFDVQFVSPDIARVLWNDVSWEDYYRLVSAPSSSGTFTEDTPHSPFPANTTYHDHAGLQPGQTLCFKLRACNGVGCSVFTGVKCVGTPYEEAKYCPSSESSGAIMFSVIAGDIRGDYAGMEIFAVNNTGTNAYYTGTKAYLISASGSTVWNYSIGRAVWSVPAIGDVDGDSRPDIVIGVDDGRVMVFDGGGYKAQISLRTDVSPPCTNAVVRAVTLVDVDENGDYEIIAVAKRCNRVYVLDWWSGGGLQVLRRFDLSSDSDNNSYAVWYKNTIYVTGLSGNLYIFDYPSYSTTVVNIVSGYGLDTPAIGDVDGDGEKEVVFGGRDGKVYIRGLDGASEGSVDLTSYVGSATCFRLSLGDANSDGIEEIYVAATDCDNVGQSYLLIIKWNGSTYQVGWVTNPIEGVNVSHPVIADFDLGYPGGEVATIAHDGSLHIYRSSDGSAISTGNLRFGGNGGRGGISVIDVDGDGRQNLVFGDRSGCIHIYEFGDGTASGTIWWGYNRQNPQQNGVR